MESSASLPEIKAFIEQKLDDELDRLNHPRNLYDPLKYTLRAGGKRLRPALLVSACISAGGEIEKALNAACAVELFHNFTLIHDDIMDRAKIRRGKEPVYRKYGLNSAILTGDVMLARAHASMYKAATEQDVHEIIRLFDEMSVALCEGQQLDNDAEQVDEITVDDYLGIIELKTAVLLGSCLQIGGLIGGADRREGKLLYRYGLGMGKAFQIQDDYLDAFGQSSRTGKERGGDIMMNKKTYLYLKTLREADASDRTELIELFSDAIDISEREKVERVTALYEKYNVQRAALDLKEFFLEKAGHCLNELSGRLESIDLLEQVGERLIYRSS